jgi:hypothetical protein
MPIQRVAFFVDGFNLYHAIDDLKRQDLKWLSLRELAQSYIHQPGEKLVKVVYFSALATWDKQKRARHMEYIKALEATGVETNIAHFKKAQKYCIRQQRRCVFYEEKQSDVALAIMVLDDAHRGLFDKSSFGNSG